jgi:predicted nucleic acid-binding protein
MTDNLITFDTNILVYSIDIGAGEKHRIASELLESAFSQPCFLAMQVLSEFFTVAVKKKNLPIDDAIAQIKDCKKLFLIAFATEHSLIKATYAVKNHSLAF